MYTHDLSRVIRRDTSGAARTELFFTHAQSWNILHSMSVGLNILIRHSFTDSWVWIMAWVPLPQLLSKQLQIISFNSSPYGKEAKGFVTWCLFIHHENTPI